MIKSAKVYDQLKLIALIWLPALATLYFAIDQIWNLNHGTQVVGTVTAVDTFLGALLQLNKSSYDNSDAKYDGAVEVTETADKKTFSLSVNGDPNDIDQKSELLLKVTPPSAKPIPVKAKAK